MICGRSDVQMLAESHSTISLVKSENNFNPRISSQYTRHIVKLNYFFDKVYTDKSYILFVQILHV
ncbi:MAG: hypothetical protein CLLPBCKN_003963 [Chroococcidiopsis cubana SAG 39.79]|nr:hypothetical protein [Chroococcidiopsis cubana SAG 39.79]